MKENIKKYLVITILLEILLWLIITLKFDHSFYTRFIFLVFSFCSILYIVIFVDKKLLKDLNRELKMKKLINRAEYYREKLDDYSPLICAKLLGKKVYDKDAITSMILYLKEKNYAGINDNNQLFIKNKHLMRKHEIFFVEQSKFIFYDLHNHVGTKYNAEYSVTSYLDKLVNDDMVEEGLINKKKNKFGINWIDATPFIYIITTIFFICSLSSNVKEIFTIQVLNYFVLLISTIWVMTYIIRIFLDLSIKSIKTNKGYEYTTKLESQKKFLKDFSQLSSRNIEEEAMWEYYIRASILYDFKGNLDNQATNFYKDIIKVYGYDDNYKEPNAIAEKIGNLVIFIFFIVVTIFYFLNIDNQLSLIILNFLILPILYLLLVRMDK